MAATPEAARQFLECASFLPQRKIKIVSVIPGRAPWREPGIHNHDREHGFSDAQLRIVALASLAPE
jgi:hypothetical protein